MDTSKNKTYKETQSLIKIFNVISWLDNRRWELERPNVFPGNFVKGVINAPELKPEQKILIHWLIYITDRVKKADVLWETSSNKIKSLVVEYFNKNLSEKEQVIELCKKYEKKNEIRAFPADLESIIRTLIILLGYNKNIIAFITRKLSEWEADDPDRFCPRISFSLYLLSYKDVGSLARSRERRENNKVALNKKTEEAMAILNNDYQFEKEFDKWYKQRWHKRTWAALRDYKKFKPLKNIFIDGMTNQTNKNIWRKDFNKQLELPGDIWNIRFFENCIKPIAQDMGIRGDARRVVRKLWEEIKPECPESYPEQFDVSFDFTPRMCQKNLCDICPFGPNGVKLICIPTEGKYCPVALACCEYIVKCTGNQEKCIFKEGIGRGVCNVARKLKEENERFSGSYNISAIAASGEDY
ncbi:MAG: hypothetical protein ACYTFK_12325 [Planctomycetota bacterium]|jgi:hypothetical protein